MGAPLSSECGNQVHDSRLLSAVIEKRSGVGEYAAATSLQVLPRMSPAMKILQIRGSKYGARGQYRAGSRKRTRSRPERDIAGGKPWGRKNGRRFLGG